MSQLSSRGQRLIDSPPLPEYINEHFLRAAEPWHAEQNPDAYVSLCIAENKLHNDALNQLLSRSTVPSSVFGYDAMHGNLKFRTRLARFLERSFLGRRFAPEQLVLLAGAGAVLEMLFYTICDPGDGVLIPTPSYAGFWFDLETRDELKIVPANCNSSDDFQLTPAILDAAIDAADCPVKALLFTTPNNPLGQVYSSAEILEIVNWAVAREIHLVVDEIYALSVFADDEFVSAAALQARLGDNVHIVWAFSKDFGASGLRCGVLISENSDVLTAVSGMAYWAACSGHTQHLLSELVADDVAVDRYLAESRHKLKQAYDRVTKTLDSFDIPYLEASAAFFLICDLRAYLEAPTWAAERKLWRKILEQAKVNLTPGEACRINEPGFFRLCYAAESGAAVEASIARLRHTLSAG